MCEETVPIYAIMIPIFVVAGYDALAGISSIWFGSCIGTMCSIILESKPYIDQKFCNETEIPELTTRFKVVLVFFFATFGIMIWGVVK